MKLVLILEDSLLTLLELFLNSLLELLHIEINFTLLDLHILNVLDKYVFIDSKLLFYLVLQTKQSLTLLFS